MGRIKLFCVPYAGGSSSIYLKWKPLLELKIEIIPLELRGRGSRFDEPFYENFSDAIQDLYDAIRPQIENERFAFFGHSMGSLIIHDLIQKIEDNNFQSPEHVFFSGCIPAHIHDLQSQNKRNDLSDQQIIEEIMEYGGTASEVFKDEELRNIFFPIIKSDYKMIDTRKHSNNKKKYNFNITILTGDNDDHVSRDKLKEWRDYTNQECNIITFSGGHFFINENTEEIVRLIESELIVSASSEGLRV